LHTWSLYVNAPLAEAVSEQHAICCLVRVPLVMRSAPSNAVLLRCGDCDGIVRDGIQN